ncbi:MAG: hypothetical protein ABGX23_02305 [Nautiliaceae bacterium]
MKKYSLFSLIFILTISLFIYFQDNSTSTYSIAGVNITLPNAIWIGGILLIFYFFSIIFMSFTSLKSSFLKKNIQKEIEIIKNNIKNKILYKDEIKEVKILKPINNFTTLINGLEITPKKIEEFEFLEKIQKLLNEEVIDISKLKIKEDNPWFLLNIKNRLKKEPSYAKEVLKKFKNEEIKKEAFYIFAKTAPIKEILKYPYDINLEILIAHKMDEKIDLLTKKAKLTPKEEITFAKEIYQTRTPDKELEILKPLKWGYAYLALKYSHLELAKKVIEENELKFFEFYLKLKENQIKADIDEYINSALCK